MAKPKTRWDFEQAIAAGAPCVCGDTVQSHYGVNGHPTSPCRDYKPNWKCLFSVVSILGERLKIRDLEGRGVEEVVITERYCTRKLILFEELHDGMRDLFGMIRERLRDGEE